MIVGWTLRDVIFVIMGIGDFVSLGYTEFLDLVEARLAGGRARVRVCSPGSFWPPLFLLPLATLVLPVLLTSVARPVARMAARLPRRVVVRVVLLLLVGMSHHGKMILVLCQGRWSAVRVHVRGLQGANYRGMIEAAR